MSDDATGHWSADTLAAIDAADDLKISPLRDDGVTYGTPTWIWAVAVDGELYVRAYHGVRSRWYAAASVRPAGRIHAAGGVYEVTFSAVLGLVQAAIDDAYRAKYADSPYLASMLSPRAQEATVKIRPRDS